MNPKLILLVLLIPIFQWKDGFSQLFCKPGYIIMTNGDTLYGKLNYNGFKHEITFHHDAPRYMRVVYSPREVKKFVVGKKMFERFIINKDGIVKSNLSWHDTLLDKYDSVFFQVLDTGPFFTFYCRYRTDREANDNYIKPANDDPFYVCAEDYQVKLAATAKKLNCDTAAINLINLPDLNDDAMALELVKFLNGHRSLINGPKILSPEVSWFASIGYGQTVFVEPVDRYKTIKYSGSFHSMSVGIDYVLSPFLILRYTLNTYGYYIDQKLLFGAGISAGGWAPVIRIKNAVVSPGTAFNARFNINRSAGPNSTSDKEKKLSFFGWAADFNAHVLLNPRWEVVFSFTLINHLGYNNNSIYCPGTIYLSLIYHFKRMQIHPHS